MAGTDRQDFDNILREVAKRTKKDKQIDELGGALDIPSYDIEPARDKNKQDNSHMGSLDLLRDWAKTQTSPTMRQTLINALTKLKRNDILGVCFPVVVADTVTVPPKGNPSRTSELPMDTTDDSSGRHGAAGPSHPPTSPDDKWKHHTVTPAKSGPDGSDREMQYVMWESLVKGNALVIGNANFPQLGQLRDWAYLDIIHMEGLFKKLGYVVQNIHSNLSESGMKEAVKEFTKQLEKDNPQSAVVYISSHGNETGIQGSDGSILSMFFFLEELSKVLRGKPKVLIIDACWGGGETKRFPVSVSSGAQTIPENADIFMIHSTSFGKTAWSTAKDGSWFVNQLCEVVYNNDRDLEDLDTIMLRVTRGMRTLTASRDGTTDNGTQSTTVLKQGVDRKLFFYPGFTSSNV